jgi:hypothetical protein
MCGGSGKDAGAGYGSLCQCQNGLMLVWKPSRSTHGYLADRYYQGYSPNVREVPADTKIVRAEKGFESADGWVYQAWAVCMDCKGELPPCDACGGSGELKPDPDLELEACKSECNASDEDPIAIMQLRKLI